MLKALGRFLQLLGLVMLPVGLLYGERGGANAMTLEFGLLGLGAAFFYAGWILTNRE